MTAVRENQQGIRRDRRPELGGTAGTDAPDAVPEDVGHVQVARFGIQPEAVRRHHALGARHSRRLLSVRAFGLIFRIVP